MRLYHGTTVESAENILRNGFDDIETVWACSVPSKTYVVTSVDEYFSDEDAILFAINAGQIAAAMKDSKQTSIAVFAFDISDDEDFNDYFMPDYSTPNNMQGCYDIDNNALNRYIAEKKIKMSAKIIRNAYEPYMRAFYLSSLCQEYLHIKDPRLQNVVDRLQKTELYWFADDYLYIEHDNFENIPDFKI